MTRRVALVTGFEAFGGHAANPSLEVAKALDGRVKRRRRASTVPASAS